VGTSKFATFKQKIHILNTTIRGGGGSTEFAMDHTWASLVQFRIEISYSGKSSTVNTANTWASLVQFRIEISYSEKSSTVNTANTWASLV